jgi:hypothetical protein
VVGQASRPRRGRQVPTPSRRCTGGDASFLGSTSKVVNQVVSKATTTTTLASSRNLSNFGQSVTFTASVTPQFSGRVKGIVTFYDGAMALKTMALTKRRRGKVHNLDTDRGRAQHYGDIQRERQL